MGIATVTRKAPSGAKHARCVHHEPYPSAPRGWLCFSDDTAPSDDAILERMAWADEIENARAVHAAAWAVRPTGDGMLLEHRPFRPDGTPYDGAVTGPADWRDVRVAPSSTHYANNAWGY